MDKPIKKLPNSIYLASKSPRRQMLLKQINVDFELIDSEIDESANIDEPALNYVRRMSIQKANAGWNSNQRVKPFPLLAADTSIAIDNVILGKPNNREEAKEMLNMLSSNVHEVVTCISLRYLINRPDKCNSKKEVIETIDSITQVKFCKLSEQDIEEYLQTGEWKDKAGSYAIQGCAARFIESISGSYSGVVGLPLFETSQIIRKALGLMQNK